MIYFKCRSPSTRPHPFVEYVRRQFFPNLADSPHDARVKLRFDLLHHGPRVVQFPFHFVPLAQGGVPFRL